MPTAISDISQKIVKKIKAFFAAAVSKTAALFKFRKSEIFESRGNKAATKRKRGIRIFLAAVAVLLELGILCSVGALVISASICAKVGQRLLTLEQASELENIDCILVLGAGIRVDGSPSDMLADRLSVGVELYNNGTAPKLLMSGDHTRTDHDEVSVMKRFATDSGVPSEDVFRDHAGICTYDSIYRAKEIFGVHKMIIVTQEYHIYRALYIAEQLGIEAYGVSASLRPYYGQVYRDIREVLARVKDFFVTLTEGQPKFLGESIPIGGNGDET